MAMAFHGECRDVERDVDEQAACQSGPGMTGCTPRHQMKPNGDPLWGDYLRRVLVVPAASLLALSTPKLRLGAFRLQFDVFYDFKRKKAGVDYRYVSPCRPGQLSTCLAILSANVDATKHST